MKDNSCNRSKLSGTHSYCVGKMFDEKRSYGESNHCAGKGFLLIMF